MPRSRYTIGEIVAELTRRIRALADQLAPGGTVEGDDYVALNPVRGDSKPGSFKICVHGARAGVWADWAAADPWGGRRCASGDALDLVAYLATGGSKAKAVPWALAWLGWSDGAPAEVERARSAAASAAAVKQKAEAERAQAARSAAAWRIWQSCRPIDGTPAVAYLKGRGIALDRLPRLPRGLRFHAGLTLPYADWRDPRTPTYPCMVAAITGAPGAGADAQGGAVAAIHRTYLDVRPDGSVRKMDLGDLAKATLGKFKHVGGAIRLWRGPGPRALCQVPLHKLPPGSAVTAAEGIENALTGVVAKPELAALCGISLGGLLSMWLPPNVAAVWYIRDNDKPGSPAALLAQDVIKSWLSRGLVVREVRAPATVKDLNDVVKPKETTDAVAEQLA